MSDPNNIPVLRSAVSRKRETEDKIDSELLKNLRAQLSADMRTLVDEILADALKESAENLQVTVNDRLASELPELIDQALRSKFGD